MITSLLHVSVKMAKEQDEEPFNFFNVVIKQEVDLPGEFFEQSIFNYIPEDMLFININLFIFFRLSFG